MLDISLFMPFILKKEFLFIRGGIANKEYINVFKGYVFLDSELEADDVFLIIDAEIRQNSEIYKILVYESKANIILHEEERLLLTRLFGSNFCLEISYGYIDHEKLCIFKGALVGMEDKVGVVFSVVDGEMQFLLSYVKTEYKTDTMEELADYYLEEILRFRE